MTRRERRPPAEEPPQDAAEDQSPATAEDNSLARQIPAWLAERVAEHQRRKGERRAARAQFGERREHGLAARRRAKLRRQGGERR